MGVYKVYDGSTWVDICDCNVHIKTLTDWQLLDPNTCILRYWDGDDWCQINCGELLLTNNTEINIWFDNSGSMNSTLPPLDEMRDTLLETCLLPVYNNNSVLYDERVKVFLFSDYPNGFESFIKLLAAPRNFNRTVDLNVNLVINLVFQDESTPYGYGTNNSFDNTQRNGNLLPLDPLFDTYDSDILNARNLINTSSYDIKGCIFRVNSGPNSYPGFKGLVEATFIDTDAYTSPNNLSDFLGSNFTYRLNTTAGSTAAYYLSQITSALNSLGINVTC